MLEWWKIVHYDGITIAVIYEPCDFDFNSDLATRSWLVLETFFFLLFKVFYSFDFYFPLGIVHKFYEIALCALFGADVEICTWGMINFYLWSKKFKAFL